MEHRGEVQPGRQPQGREAVAGDAEPGQRLVVGAPRERVRQHGGLRVHREQRRDHRVDEVPAEGRLEGDVAVDLLDPHVRPGELGDDASCLVLEARQEPRVQDRLGPPGDDVGLVAGGQLRGVGGVPQRRADEPRARAQRGDEAVDGGRVLRVVRQAGEVRDALEQVAHGRGELQRPRVRTDPRDGGRQVRHGVVGVDLGAVARAAVRDEPQPADALLRCLQQVGTPPALAVRPGTHLDGEPTHLADGLRRAREELRTGVHGVSRPVDAPGLLVREERQHDVARRGSALAHHLAHDGEHHRVHVLHVHGPAAPEHAVDLLAAERVDGPVLRGGGHHVGVTVQHQRRPARVHPGQSHDDVRPPRRGLEELRLEPDLLQRGHDVLGRCPLPRPGTVAVVRRVDPQQVLADAGDLVLGGHAAGRDAGDDGWVQVIAGHARHATRPGAPVRAAPGAARPRGRDLAAPGTSP